MCIPRIVLNIGSERIEKLRIQVFIIVDLKLPSFPVELLPLFLDAVDPFLRRVLFGDDSKEQPPLEGATAQLAALAG